MPGGAERPMEERRRDVEFVWEKGKCRMKRKVRIFGLISWMLSACMIFAGCGGTGLLDEVPKDYALYGDASEAASGEAAGEVMPGLPVRMMEEPAPEGASGESFLMEEAFPYAYSCLSEAEQIWYHDMERILGCYGEEMELGADGLEAGLDDASVDRIFQCVMEDHPELFFVEGYSYTKYLRGDRIVSIEFSGTYNVGLEAAVGRREEILAATARILAGVDEDASDYDKVKYVYDTLISDTEYDLSASDSHNIYSVLVNHASVCQGYAKATQYLLNKLGVECALVLGTVESGEGHAWNLVKVDGSYYFVDTTWGDVSYQVEDGEASPEEQDAPPAVPEINYDYLNVTTQELLRTHSIGGEVPMPVCTAREANYYVREGALFTSYDREQMEALFQSAADAGRDSVTIKCADSQCFQEILTAFIDGQEIFSYLKDGESSIAYAKNEKQLSMTFWVTNE